MSKRRSTAQTLGIILLAIVAIRLAFDVLNLACRLLAWLLLRACWALEWAVDRLTVRETLRPSGGVHDAALPVARVAPVTVAPRQPDDVARLCKVLGRNDPETRRLAESMLASSTRVAGH